MNERVDMARSAGFPQPDPLSPDRLARFEAAFARLFGTGLPADYAELFMAADGFDFDGLVVFGSHDRTGVDGFRPGLFDSNERLLHGVSSLESPLRFIGENGDLLLAYDTEEAIWKSVARYGWHTVSRHRSFGELFDAALTTTHAKD